MFVLVSIVETLVYHHAITVITRKNCALYYCLCLFCCQFVSSCCEQNMDKQSGNEEGNLFHIFKNLFGKVKHSAGRLYSCFLLFQLQSVLAALVDWIWMAYNVSNAVLYLQKCGVWMFMWERALSILSAILGHQKTLSLLILLHMMHYENWIIVRYFRIAYVNKLAYHHVCSYTVKFIPSIAAYSRTATSE
jgi:hypothetical protein